MATHANILACKIPWTEEPGGLWSMWLQRVRHDWVTEKVKMKVTQLFLTCCNPMDWSPPGSSVHGILQTRILEKGSCSLLQGIFPIQESNPGLLHCRQILYCLSHQGKYARIYSFFFSYIFISWRLITLQYCSGFCHTLTWISHGFTCVPHTDPRYRLPPYLIPLGLPSAPALSTCLMHPTWAGGLFHPW